MELYAVAEQSWHRIDKAPKGIGDVLLRSGSGPLDPNFVGHQDPDSGRWFDGENREVRPAFYCEIQLFDADDSDGVPSL
jgi:hypothetical protein